MTRAAHTSVVIPAHRAWSTLPRVLRALEAQIGPDHEVVLVDSDPGPQARGRELEGYGHWLRVVRVAERLSPGQARNLGAAHARGEVLVFLDADAVPAHDWLARLEAAVTPAYEAVGGAIANGLATSAVATAEYLLTCSETFPGRARPIRHAPSANLLVRRSAFITAGGFDERLSAGEDTVLTFPIARRGRLAFAPDAVVWHIGRTEVRPFLSNQRRQGAAMIAICDTVPYPHAWVTRRPLLLIAGPLRLMALGRLLAHNPAQARTALRAVPYMLLGTVAWTLGAWNARRTHARGARAIPGG